MTTPALARLPRWLRILRSRPRLLTCTAVGIAATLLMPGAVVPNGPSRWLLGWNAGALLYLALAWQMMRSAGIERMRQRAILQDEGRSVVLVLVVLAAVAVVVAVGTQLSSVKDFHGLQKSLHVGLAAFTVLTAWLFTQTLFTLHYAHGYYVERHHHRSDPLQFPGTPDPDYADFFYFACVIGTSGQTADVAFQGQTLRRVGVVHCILAFFFNATILALAVNIGAGLL